MKRKTLYVIAFVAILFNALFGAILFQHHYEVFHSGPKGDFVSVEYPFYYLGMFMLLASMFTALLTIFVSLAFYHSHKGERTSFGASRKLGSLASQENVFSQLVLFISCAHITII